MNLNAITLKNTSDDNRVIIESLIADFLKYYYEYINKMIREYMDKKNQNEDELKYSLFCVPGPSQYHAFFSFFCLLKEKEHILNNPDTRKNLYMHDCLYMDEMKCSVLEVLENVSSTYDVKGRKIVFASGSFWKQHLSTRKKMILLLNELDAKGADVRIYTQAKENEENMCGLNKSIIDKAHFNLQERIAIHYIQIDDDCILLEFPHTEITEFRLNWFINFNSMDLEQGKTKSDVLHYFNSLVEGSK